MSDKRRRRVQNSDESEHSDSDNEAETKNTGDELDQENDEGVASVSINVLNCTQYRFLRPQLRAMFPASGIFIANIYGIPINKIINFGLMSWNCVNANDFYEYLKISSTKQEKR